MNATAPPPKPAIIRATPINVEESRAQRLHRQQARFRDRGGIFVPTNRNTLLDILLGKAEPLKKPRRSASVSPSRANEEKSSTANEASKPALRRSPRKQSQKTFDVVTEEQPPAIAGSEVIKPAKRATSSKGSRSRPQNKAKVPQKSTTKPSGGPLVVEDAVVGEKSNKGTVDALEKKLLKTSTKRIVPHADDDDEDNIPPVKSKPKGKGVSKTNSQGEVDGAKGTSRIRVTRTKKVDPVYSELSEDDVTCKPTNKASTKKVKKSAVSPKTQQGKGSSNLKQIAPSQLPDGLEEDEEKSGASSRVKASLLKGKLVARPAKSPNASDDDGDDNMPLIKSKSKNKVTSQENSQEIDGAKCRLEPTEKAESKLLEDCPKPKKRPTTKRELEDDVTCKPTKKSTAKKVKASETAPCQLPVPSKSSSNVSPRGNKRDSTSITQDSDWQPPRKRIKSDTLQPDLDPSLHKKSNFSEVPFVISKKRQRNSEDTENGVDDGVEKSTKRKKHSGRSENKRPPQIPVEEDSVEPVTKRSSKTKAMKSTSKSKKQSSGKTTAASKCKENALISKPSKEKVAPRSGPPKSILQRIKDSLGAQVADNEPDPIDFLS